MTLRQVLVSQERIYHDSATVEKGLHEEGEANGIQEREAGTERGETGGDAERGSNDDIYKPNQPDPKEQRRQYYCLVS